MTTESLTNSHPSTQIKHTWRGEAGLAADVQEGGGEHQTDDDRKEDQ